MLERLKKEFPTNVPIFYDEIRETYKERTTKEVDTMISNALKNNELAQFDSTIYYFPTMTELGLSNILSTQVLEKKYISYNNKIFGIYGSIYLELSFNLSTQVPSVFSVVSNKATTDFEMIGYTKTYLSLPYLPITNENRLAYMILEFFSNIKIEDYLDNNECQNTVKKFMRENNIRRNQILTMLAYFPKNTFLNLMKGGIICGTELLF